MGAIKWYKRSPQDALNGMLMLTLEERGAYNTVLDLIYSHDNNLHDDDRFIAGWMRCDIRVWKRIKIRLVELGKIVIENGLVTNFRATSEIDEALARGLSMSDVSRSKGIKSGIVRNNNKDLAEPADEPKTNTTTLTTTVRKKEYTHTREGPFPIDFIFDQESLDDPAIAAMPPEHRQREINRARDWALSKNIHRTDWQAFMRNWLRDPHSQPKDTPNGKRQRGKTSIQAGLDIVGAIIANEKARQGGATGSGSRDHYEDIKLVS